MADFATLKKIIDPHKQTDKQFFLDLLDGDKQRAYEDERVGAVMAMLRIVHISRLRNKINAAREEKAAIKSEGDFTADKYRRVLELNAQINILKSKLDEFKPFFSEPYFARMDLTDPKEGYNSYYIGKHGDERLEIIDWRAPLAQKYYQKSRTAFKINEYDYRLILRRALRTANGKVLDIKNEYLSLNGFLSKEEIAGRDESLIFDPFLKEILRGRKEKNEICDIIETIQEKQFEIITLPEREEFVLQGVAGSGKTMIMLHRLSYIMYNNESVRPTDVLVITPSDSFNAFIDELSSVLELEKVKTSTLDNYYMNLLKSAGVDISSKTDFNAPVPADFLAYIYSEKFVKDARGVLCKIYDGIYGLFDSPECREAANEVGRRCASQTAAYEKIKNASLRIRRCVLGEIKEKPDGGLYYTKQFRYMFNCVSDVGEFLNLIASDARMKNYAFFYRQLLSFYKSIKYLRRYSYKICLTAVDDLKILSETVEKEIRDLRRYRIKTAEKEEFTYAEGIEKREQLKTEIDSTVRRVEEILSSFSALYDFTDVLRGDKNLVAIGKCENVADILRFFNREIVKKAKKRFGVELKPLIKCDPFALCLILTELGVGLSPKYSFIFVDEAQDISTQEYAVLKRVNDRAVFNIFGDLKQNITPYRGLKSWDKLGLRVYELKLNYRNTNQIVECVSRSLGVDMSSIGFEGADIAAVGARSATGWLSSKNGLKAVICSENNLKTFAKKSYNVLRDSGKISKSKINVMTVYESKGLEFTAVAVADGDMSDNEKYIAYTRALKELAIIK